jgi:hypothetical protein
MWRRVPNRVSAEQVQELAREHPTVARCIESLDPRAHDFPLRDVGLYGIAECARSMRAGRLLDSGDMAALGETMNVSHDGDRVATWQSGEHPFSSRATDDTMAELVRRATALAPLRDGQAALWQQPGAYDCSTPEIDAMVDCVLDTEGVLGAQLAGAGLGGCIMVLARKVDLETVQERLIEAYYAPAGVEPRMFACEPSTGSQVLTDVRTLL